MYFGDRLGDNHSLARQGLQADTTVYRQISRYFCFRRHSNVPHGTGPRAGSILAALFLREFTGKRPWAHLDIAGAARSSAEDGDRVKRATGFGTRLLLRWLTAPDLRLRDLHGCQ